MQNMSRNLKTCLMIATWIFVGIFSAIIGATIIDLTEIAECDLEAIGQVLIGLNLAIPIGSIAAGILCDRYSNDVDLVICTFLVTLSLSSAALPWCPAIGLMATVMVIQGVSRGVVTCCGNVMIFQMWKEKSSAPLHAMHFGTGFGSFIAPLMVEPFLSEHSNITDDNSTVEQSDGHRYLYHQTLEENSSRLLDTAHYQLTSVTVTSKRESVHSHTQIPIPYGIMGAFGILCAAAFLIFFVRAIMNKTKRGESKESDKKRKAENQQPSKRSLVKFTMLLGSCANGDAAFGAQMAAMLFFFYACVIGMVMSYPTYLLPVVVRGKLHLTKQQGIYLTSGYWGSFAAGRLISAPLAKFVSVRTMFIFELVSSLITAGLLAFHSFTSIVYLWSYTCAFALVSASLFPSGIAWAEHYVSINGPLMATIQSGVGFGSLLASWLGGFGVDRFGPTFPLLLNFAFSIGAGVLYVLMQIKASLHGKKSCTVNYEGFETKEEKTSNPPDTYI